MQEMQETWVDPWVRKMPWRRKWQSTPVFLPRKSCGQRSLEGYSPWGHKELDMTEQLGTHTVWIYEKTIRGENRILLVGHFLIVSNKNPTKINLKKQGIHWSMRLERMGWNWPSGQLVSGLSLLLCICAPFCLVVLFSPVSERFFPHTTWLRGHTWFIHRSRFLAWRNSSQLSDHRGSGGPFSPCFSAYKPQGKILCSSVTVLGLPHCCNWLYLPCS